MHHHLKGRPTYYPWMLKITTLIHIILQRPDDTTAPMMSSFLSIAISIARAWFVSIVFGCVSMSILKQWIPNWNSPPSHRSSPHHRRSCPGNDCSLLVQPKIPLFDTTTLAVSQTLSLLKLSSILPQPHRYWSHSQMTYTQATLPVARSLAAVLHRSEHS